MFTFLRFICDFSGTLSQNECFEFRQLASLAFLKDASLSAACVRFCPRVFIFTCGGGGRAYQQSHWTCFKSHLRQVIKILLYTFPFWNSELFTPLPRQDPFGFQVTILSPVGFKLKIQFLPTLVNLVKVKISINQSPIHSHPVLTTLVWSSAFESWLHDLKFCQRWWDPSAQSLLPSVWVELVFQI